MTIRTGTELTEQIIEVARLFGWQSAHFRPARMKDGSWRTAVTGDGKGFPDLVLIRPPRIVVAECKSKYEKLSIEQEYWIYLFSACPNVETFVWQDADFDEIEKVLK